MSTMWPDEYTGGSHHGATNGAYACPICKQASGHIEGCQNHPNYFRECLMDARYLRATRGAK